MPRLGYGRPQGVAAGLEETNYWELQTVTWSYAAHVAIVEVDPEIVIHQPWRIGSAIHAERPDLKNRCHR
jgi:hypothetical protein